MIRPERIHVMNGAGYNPEGTFVLYRMQASVRTECNLALAEAVRIANELRVPLTVAFYLDPHFPEANYRHFSFLIDGLRDVAGQIKRMGGRFILLAGGWEQAWLPLLAAAACVVTDRGYLRVQRQWREWFSGHSSCRLVEVEDNLIVPVESASSKAEWAARTIRPRIMGKLDYFRHDGADKCPPLVCRVETDPKGEERNEQVMTDVLSLLRRDAWLPAVALCGGETAARRLLDDFVNYRAGAYAEGRNDPSLVATSRLSAYLHFGHISPLSLLRATEGKTGDGAFAEQLAVRRELAHNYVWFTSAYDSYEALPSWARRTLAAHRADSRPRLYALAQMESAATHDPCWNAAMTEMIRSGYMENTMRMYWGKKIIEWSPSPEEAYSRTLYLNNRYFLDGRDANSFVGVGWCFGLHDRPWHNRSVFGLVRYMNEAGLRRKYDMETYIRRWL